MDTLRTKQEIEEYLLSKKLEERMRITHSRYCIPVPFDDFFQDYRLQILSGNSQHQTLDQYAIDYIRKTLGRNGQKKNLLNYFQLDEEVDSAVIDGSSIDLRTLLNSLTGQVRHVCFLYFLNGMDTNEVGLILDVTPGRVSQIIKSMKEVLSVQFDELS